MTIICHYYGIPWHKSHECRKKQRDQAKNEHGQTNIALITQTSIILTVDTTTHIFSAICDKNGPSSSYVDSGANQHMSLQKEFFRDYQLLEIPMMIILGDRSHNAFGYGFHYFKNTNWRMSIDS